MSSDGNPLFSDSFDNKKKKKKENMEKEESEKDEKKLTTWYNFLCDLCQTQPIIGRRYHLGNHNFDMCQKCWDNDGIEKKLGKYKALDNMEERGKNIILESTTSNNNVEKKTSNQRNRIIDTRIDDFSFHEKERKSSSSSSPHISNVGEEKDILIHLYDLRSNGSRYIGEVNSEHQCHGKGTYFYPGGSVLDGNFLSGKKHGECVFYDSFSGDTIEEVYKNGMKHGVFRTYRYYWENVAKRDDHTMMYDHHRVEKEEFLKNVSIFFSDNLLESVDFQISSKSSSPEPDDVTFTLKDPKNVHMEKDKSFLLSFFLHYGREYQFLSDEEMKMDKDIILAAISSFPKAALFYLTQQHPDYLLQNRELCIDIVRKNGLCLEFFPSELQNDAEIAELAVHQNTEALKYVSENVQRSEPQKIVDFAISSLSHSPFVDLFQVDRNRKEMDVTMKVLLNAKEKIHSMYSSSSSKRKKQHSSKITTTTTTTTSKKQKKKKRKKRKNIEEEDNIDNFEKYDSSFSSTKNWGREEERILEDLFEWLIITEIDLFGWREPKKKIEEHGSSSSFDTLVFSKGISQLSEILKVRDRIWKVQFRHFMDEFDKVVLKLLLVEKKKNHPSILGSSKAKIKKVFYRVRDRIFNLHPYYLYNNNDNIQPVGGQQQQQGSSSTFYLGFMFHKKKKKKNHEYFHHFNTEKKYGKNRYFRHGYGVVFSCQSEGFIGMRKKIYRRVFSGEFRCGMKNGLGTEFVSGKNRVMIRNFVGEFKNDRKNGRGKEYSYCSTDGTNNSSMMSYVSYQGLYSDMNRHGMGERYFRKTNRCVREEYVHGTTKVNQEEEKRIVEVYHGDIHHFLIPENLVGYGYEGNVYRVRKNDILSLRYETDLEFVAVKKSNFLRSIDGVVLQSELTNGFRLLQQGIVHSSDNNFNVLQNLGILVGYKYHGIVMEYCPFSVYDFIKEEGLKNKFFPDFDVSTNSTNIHMKIIHDTCKGLKTLHDQNLIHRDLRWEKVLMDEYGVMKLSPLGIVACSDISKHTQSMTLKEDESVFKIPEVFDAVEESLLLFGTIGYIAPEIVLGYLENRGVIVENKSSSVPQTRIVRKEISSYSSPEKRASYGKESDIYSFGIMIYCLLWKTKDPYEKYLGTDILCECGVRVSSFCMLGEVDNHVAKCNLRPLFTKRELLEKANYDEYSKFLIYDVMIPCLSGDPSQRPSCGDILRHEAMKKFGRTRECDVEVVLKFPNFGFLFDEVLVEERRMRLRQPILKKLIHSIQKRFPFVSKIDHLQNQKNGKIISSDHELCEVISIFSDKKKRENIIFVNVLLEKSNSSELETIQTTIQKIESDVLGGGGYKRLIEDKYLDHILVEKDHFSFKDLQMMKEEMDSQLSKVYFSYFDSFLNNPSENYNKNSSNLFRDKYESLITRRFSHFITRNFGVKKDLKHFFTRYYHHSGKRGEKKDVGLVHLGQVKNILNSKKYEEEEEVEGEEEEEGETENNSIMKKKYYIPDGFGILFEMKVVSQYSFSMFMQKRKEVYSPVYIGMIKEGKRSGFGVVFKRSFSGDRSICKYLKYYEGEFRNDFMDGKGKLYHQKFQNVSSHNNYRCDSPISVKGRTTITTNSNPNPTNVYFYSDVFQIVSFEGEFKNNLKHGRGEEFSLQEDDDDSENDQIFGSGARVTRGVWHFGILNPKSVFRFDCPLIQYRDFKKYFHSDSKIGFGGYGSVFKVAVSSSPEFSSSSIYRKLVNKKREQFVAFKVMHAETGFQTNLLFAMVKRAVGLCSSINSRHILKIKGVFREGNKVGYMMEYMDYSLDKLIGLKHHHLTDTLTKKKKILKETAEAILDMHRASIMHRDLKWGNVLINDDGTVKICDFDTLKDDERLWRMESDIGVQTSNVGTPGMISPEVFLGNNYSLSGDVFAYGLMMYSLIFHTKNPYFTQYQCTCGVMMKNILESKILDYHVANCNLRPLLVPKQVEKLPSYLIELMIQCWDRKIFNRPSFEEIVHRFNLEKEKNFCIVILDFDKFHSSSSSSSKNNNINPQKVFLVKPYKVDQIFKWVERKFEGSKVVTLEHPIVGTIGKDDDELLAKIIEKQENPTVSVQLDRIDENKVFADINIDNVQENKKMKKLQEENEMVKKKNMELLSLVESLRKENEVLRTRFESSIVVEDLRKENEELKRKLKDME